MSFSLIPRIVTDKLTDITPQMLHDLGIEFLMLDFDNTIVPYTTETPLYETGQWLKEMQTSLKGICVVSNSKKSRVPEFCEARGIPCVTHAKKPFSKGIRECCDRFGLDVHKTALVGDQIYTDVLGANCAGAVSILVKPIHLHNIWLTMRHWLELPFIAIGKRRMK